MTLKIMAHLFQSTLPVRGGTGALYAYALSLKISIHPPREGRDLTWKHWIDFCGISIHPPREGRDGPAKFTDPKEYDFNPPSP